MLRFLLFFPTLLIATPQYYPVVQMHGMGDFAESTETMVPRKKLISERLNGTYVLNVALEGGEKGDDLMNGLFGDIVQMVEEFHEIVSSNKYLKDGFNAIGYAQGALIIRGYVEFYNDPPVLNFVSVHAPQMGIAEVPECKFNSNICMMMAPMVQAGMYAPATQAHLTEAAYYRDVMQLTKYHAMSKYLRWINMEYPGVKDSGYRERMVSLNSFVLVKAKEDTVVEPKESSWFGYYKDNETDSMWSMEEAPWYQEDWFGLKTLGEDGKLHLLETEGDHMEVPDEVLSGWIDQYFTAPPLKD